MKLPLYCRLTTRNNPSTETLKAMCVAAKVNMTGITSKHLMALAFILKFQNINLAEKYASPYLRVSAVLLCLDFQNMDVICGSFQVDE